MEHFWPAMRPLLQTTITEVFDHSFLWIEDRRAPTREKEGLGVAAQVEGPLHEIPSSFDWNGLKWTLCLDDAQKTGLYLDQRDNHLRAAQMARDFGHRLAWDVCCFQGGFGLHLLKQGIPTEFVDASDRSLELVRGNVDLNSSLQGVAYKTHRADVFEWIRARYDSKDRADLIVLDPPSFSKSSSHREAALRGLKELNLRALHCLNNGGVLVSCVCSAAVSGEDLDSVVRQAAHDCRRSVKLLERRGPAFDHAPRLDFPEGDYLKAHFYRVEDNPRA
jgi:23S rRNA (cytosine1962-C5)-methyltransferase